MNKANFTSDRIARFECEAGKRQTLFWDAKTPGLGLRVSDGGSKSYIFESRLNGKTIRTTIGDIRTWTIAKAQAEATRLKSLCDQGTDPRELKAEQQAKAEAKRTEATRQQITLGEVWPRYIDARKAKWGERHLADHYEVAQTGGAPKRRGKGLTSSGPLFSLLQTRIADLTGKKIAAWLEHETASRPTSSALAFRLLRGCLNWCESEDELKGLVPDGALKNKKVADALPEPKSKDDCLQREQLPGWFAAVRQINNPVIAAYLQGLLLTGARREELAGLRWADVDFQWHTMAIRDKVEGSRTIPLTPFLGHLLASLPRRNEWVFSSPTAEDGRLVNALKSHVQALDAAGLPHVSLHGLRRSFGTLSEWVEMPTGIVAQIMGHKPSALAEKHYRKRPVDLLRKWHTHLEAWILEQAGVAFSASEQQERLRLVK